VSEDTNFRPRNLVLASVGLALATFMQVLDTTIANVSLPTIAGNLGVSSDQSTWVITAFTVSNAISLPLTGFLSRRFGEVRLFSVATLLFSLASFLCETAHSMSMLVALRALQGAVAGLAARSCGGRCVGARASAKNCGSIMSVSSRW
jgi:DHA2 family multidrug resistance protein